MPDLVLRRVVELYSWISTPTSVLTTLCRYSGRNNSDPITDGLFLTIQDTNSCQRPPSDETETSPAPHHRYLHDFSDSAPSADRSWLNNACPVQ